MERGRWPSSSDQSNEKQTEKREQWKIWEELLATFETLHLFHPPSSIQFERLGAYYMAFFYFFNFFKEKIDVLKAKPSSEPSCSGSTS